MEEFSLIVDLHVGGERQGRTPPGKSVEPEPSSKRRRLRFLWPRNETARRISLFIARLPVAEAIYKRINVFGFPDCCTRADLDGLGKTSGAATFPN